MKSGNAANVEKSLTQRCKQNATKRVVDQCQRPHERGMDKNAIDAGGQGITQTPVMLRHLSGDSIIISSSLVGSQPAGRSPVQLLFAS